MYQFGDKNIRKHRQTFQRFKRKIRTEIEQPMLKKTIPNKTILKNIYAEKHDGKLTFARQLGSYPILVGIPGVHQLNKFYNVKIIDYGYRSITGIPYPLDINTAKRETIEAIPGIGKKRAIRILANRPFINKNQIKEALDDPDLVENIIQYLSMKN